jgi:NAD(P)-dependent dehydrogenase (short-subunit alcohol dehydrogenase family)
MGLLEAHAGLAGKKAAIVGGAYGHGRGVSMALAKAGVDIAMCDRDQDSLNKIGPEIKALGRKVLTVHADVLDPPALHRFYDQVEKEFQTLDIVVNMAGGVKRKPFFETTPEDNARDIRLNYGYVIDSIRRCVPLIRKGKRGGSIINFTTVEAHRGAATFAVYAGAKAANTNFSRAMAVELGAERIRVNLVAPDTTPSRGGQESMGPEMVSKLEGLPAEAYELLHRMYIPQADSPAEEDLVNAVLFLASDLSKTITGTTIHVDGGTMAAAGFLNWPFGDGYLPTPFAGTLGRIFGTNK